jgi:cytochrome c oxidase subunit IV
MEQAQGVEPTHKQPNYMLVWGVLAVLMLCKVGLTYVGWPKNLTVALLVVVAMWKAALVAMYYMHLRFEPRRLIIMVLAPLPLALILVLAVLTEF